MPIAAMETGLMQLPGSRDKCSDLVLMYTCVTTGRGATELTLSGDLSDTTPFEFLHSQYETGADVNETRLDGNVIAGNLSRSADKDCFDILDGVMDYCYITRIVVRLTERTRCRTITCQTRVRIGDMDVVTEFGNASLTRSTLFNSIYPSSVAGRYIDHMLLGGECCHIIIAYSGISELRTPRDHAKVSAIGRCPLYRECTR